MVHQWQKLFYNERYSFTELADNPDFVKPSDAYGWRGLPAHLLRPEEVESTPRSTRCWPQRSPTYWTS